MHTYEIGEEVFSTHCQLMLSNTHHRHSDSLDEQTMDYSKRRDNLHNSAILAFQSLHKNAVVIQLHGFNQNKRCGIEITQALAFNRYINSPPPSVSEVACK